MGKKRVLPSLKITALSSPLHHPRPTTRAKKEVAQLSLISWNITKRCNMHCAHCYLPSSDRLGPSQEELNTQESLRLIDEIAAVSPGVMLIFTGGEPLLRPDLLELNEKLGVRGKVRRMRV